MDLRVVHHWMATYEALWRRAGTATLAEAFTDDVVYLPSPWAAPVRGLAALADFWEAERDGPDETFTMRHEVVAVDGELAVVRVEVGYAHGERWRDLWVIRFDDEGRCAWFEEWPFAPAQHDGH